MPELITLRFIRLQVPRLIPVELIDSVKGRTFTAEQFYVYQEQQVDNPYNFLYAIVDDDSKIQGYLWAEVNALDGSLFVNTFSISKKYWGKGEAIHFAVDYVRQLKEQTKSPRVFWCTSNRKFFSKNGFKESKMCLMEYNDTNEKDVQL